MNKERLDEILSNSNTSLENARRVTEQYFREEHYNKWLDTMKNEYNSLYPSQRDMTDDEKQDYDNTYFNEENPKPDNFEYPKISLVYIKTEEEKPEVVPPLTEYIVDENYLTFEEWLNEEKVVQEEIVDEDGIIVQPEIREKVRPYEPPSEEWLQEQVYNYQLYNLKLKTTLENAIQSYIDNEAKARGYDNIVSATSYAGYENPYQEEAVKLGKFRSSCWSKAYEIQADVEANNRPIPSIDEVLSELPKFEDIE